MVTTSSPTPAAAREPQEIDVTVVIPTFREAENLPLLIPRVAAALEAASLHGEILVVDDASPDATVPVCEKLARAYPLRLILRQDERGLSSAVLRGLREGRGRILLVMDADLSHPPERIPELVAVLDDPAVDFAIGSRYVPGGSTAEGWGLRRWLNSRVATWLARPLTRTRDPMAGFFALRRETLAMAQALSPVGYKIGLELMVKCDCRNVREIPIDFVNRVHGQSKLTLREQLNYLRHLKRLYQFRLGRLARPLFFGGVGASGMVIDLLAFTLFLVMLPLEVARALAIWIAMSWNFWLNRRITFSETRGRSPWVQYPLFCLSCGAGALVNWAVSLALCYRVPFFGEHEPLAAVVGIAAGAVLNYLLCAYLVFRPPAGE